MEKVQLQHNPQQFSALFDETRPLFGKYAQLFSKLALACNTEVKDDQDLQMRMALIDELFGYAQSDSDLPAIFANAVSDKVYDYEQANLSIPEVTQAEALSHFIKEHNLKQKDLAEVAPQSVISEILRGKRKMTVAHIKGFAKRFNVPEKTFMG